MPESKRLTLIIDANNLAHYLDHLSPGQILTQEEVKRLAVILSNYARTVQPHLTIELCFDFLPPDIPVLRPPWVHCLVASARSSADDLVRERFRFHQHHDEPCIAITNDGEIREDIEEEGGRCLLIFDFVRRTGKSPVFRQPNEFFTERPRRKAAVRRQIPEMDWSRLSAPPQEVALTLAPREEKPTTPDSPNDAQDEAQGSSQADRSEAACACSGPAYPVYRLSLETWPLEKGLEFLLDSFCPAHRTMEEWHLYRSLLAGEIQPKDLCDLADLLRTHCGDEPEFARQGSLMKRVRLALIQAAEHKLNLGEIAQATAQKVSGLQGRIREKAVPWVEILPEK